MEFFSQIISFFITGGFPGILWDNRDHSCDTDDEDDDAAAAEKHLNVGYKVVDMAVHTYENEHSILRVLPTGDLHPQPFVAGAREKFEKVAAAVKARHGMDFPGAVIQWAEFLKMAPQTDDVYEYIAEHPLYVPFKEVLFGISSADVRYAAESSSSFISKHVQQQDEDAAAKARGDDAEIWQTMPCMDGSAKAAFERVKPLRNEEGGVSYVPYYTDDGDDLGGEENFDDEVCSSEDEGDYDEGSFGTWCTVRRKGNVPKYGDALVYVGLQYQRKTDATDRLQSGIIRCVARNKAISGGELHFRLEPHSESDALVDHVNCKVVMSTSRKNIYKVSHLYFLNYNFLAKFLM
jgi:hypothetical protein